MKDNEFLKYLTNLLGSTAKRLVVCLVSVLILISTSWTPIYYISGGIINGFFSKLLKRLIQAPRPKDCVKRGYGMPSSHAQSLFYFYAVTTYSLCRTLQYTTILFVSLLFLVYPILARYVVPTEMAAYFEDFLCIVLRGYNYSSYYRIQHNMHTPAQTVVGGLLGLTLAGIAITVKEYVDWDRSCPIRSSDEWLPRLLRQGFCGLYLLAKHFLDQLPPVVPITVRVCFVSAGLLVMRLFRLRDKIYYDHLKRSL